jgi:SNF2 family DNA or RNA helicase
MGLGKTITTIALLYCLHFTLKRKGDNLPPTLIVCPATLINQWQDEMKTWALPTLHAPEIMLFHSADSEVEKRKILKKVQTVGGVLIVSYDTLRIEHKLLSSVAYFYMVLDEGQKVKNNKSQVFNAVTMMKAKHRLVLTGTPMQNNLTELWSLFHFV